MSSTTADRRSLPAATLVARPEIVRWPSGARQRAALGAAGVPCLLAVDRGEAPPVVGPLEDWIWADGPERDAAARLANLAARAVQAPAPRTRTAVRSLVAASPRLVSFETLARVLPGRPVPAAVPALVEAERSALAADGWDLVVIEGVGALVQPHPGPDGAG